MEELYLSKYPTVYKKSDVTKYLMDNLLLFKVGVNINRFLLVDDPKYTKHVDDLVARHLAEKFIADKKLEVTMYDSVTTPDKRLEATAITISPKELMKLLYDFGVCFEKEKPHELG